ncbi:hypothetical protein [Streptomyces sp. NPDC052042]|uniref:hypothetical protein n=1 Tax=Streptomyces sp. NPDC052042 TaxID=3365683 RepID=UPI0037D7776A
MKVSLLVDEPARRLMIRRLEDTAEGDHVYQVGGFGGSAQAYISDYGLEDTLGLLAGHYLCDLVEDGPDNTRAAVIALDERTQPRTRKP